MSENKALNFIEELGAHAVYEDAKNSYDDLEKVLISLEDLLNQKRSLENQKYELETEVAIDERGKHSDMAETRMEKHLKLTHAVHPEIKEIRLKLQILQSQILEIEHRKFLLETAIRISTARLTELSGLFHFFAALKESNTADKANQVNKTKRPGDPW